ncbi:Cytosolic iron-sulfur assembly component 2B [Clonorchis sinensis]|uniref:Cytosolic iron-sulfur assembly component 2B n=1 Tax=Clonorchis sinensis TaxID=79923 RepID=A0A8T1N170_CLOSI|nr:Cytosolic iron-sulfur assembly component 2B [Clonorchis sinensis]
MNANPVVLQLPKRTPKFNGFAHVEQANAWDGLREPIDAQEVFEHIREVRDPEHPYSLEALGVVSETAVSVKDSENLVSIQFTPTIPACSLATLIGLAIKVKLTRSLPRRFKIKVSIAPGTHISEEEINKQLADKERVAAALENPTLRKLVDDCLIPSIVSDAD